MAFLNEYGVAQLWAAMKDRLSGAFNKVDFDVAEAAANLVSGDSIPTAFGKLAKNYSSILTSISDLNTSLGNRISEVNTSLGNRISEVNTSLGNRISEVNTDLTSKIDTKLNKSDVLANYTTTATGKALDASLGPTIKEKMDLVDTLRRHDVLAIDDATGTEIPSGMNINSYTTPGVYYVASDAIAANISNLPRKSSGKLLVGSRHGSDYLYQEYYPSSNKYYHYIRSYASGIWSMWVSELYDYLEIGQRTFSFTGDGISSASNKTIDTLFNIPYTYGAYFLILRADTILDATWVGIVRHNARGYQVSTVYKGTSDQSPYVTTDGILKTNSTTSISVYAIFFPIYVWD